MALLPKDLEDTYNKALVSQVGNFEQLMTTKVPKPGEEKFIGSTSYHIEQLAEFGAFELAHRHLETFKKTPGVPDNTKLGATVALTVLQGELKKASQLVQGKPSGIYKDPIISHYMFRVYHMIGEHDSKVSIMTERFGPGSEQAKNVETMNAFFRNISSLTESIMPRMGISGKFEDQPGWRKWEICSEVQQLFLISDGPASCLIDFDNFGIPQAEKAKCRLQAIDFLERAIEAGHPDPGRIMNELKALKRVS